MKNLLKSVTAALLIGLSTPALADDPLKIGFIIPNAIGQIGWDYELNRGLDVMKEHFGDKIEVTAVDSVGEGPDATRVMTRLVAQGTNVLFLGSFGHMNDGLALAKQNPGLAVIHAGGYMNDTNFATYAVRHYEGAYLAGMAAGYATKDGQLGIVAAFPLPEVLGIMNSYVLGAQSVNPGLKDVKVIWLNSWYDPARERASTESLIAEGSDVIFSLFPGTTSTVATAEEKGVYVVATLSDITPVAPTKHLAGIQANFGPIYINLVQSILDHTFEGKDTFAGIKDGAVEIASLSPDLTADQKAAILAKQEEIRAGSFAPFTGPITDNTGAEVVAAGASLDDGAIKSMAFIVKGIDTTLPN